VSTIARPFWSAIVLCGVIALLAVTLLPSVSMAQTRLANVDVMLVFEARDTASWVAFHEEVLGTPPEGSTLLGVSVADETGATRSLTIAQPRFIVSMVKGAPMFRVVVNGKVAGGTGLGAFEFALIESQSRPDEQLVGMFYGLSSVGVHILEMHVSRP
jgi:hypothetical protein